MDLQRSIFLQSFCSKDSEFCSDFVGDGFQLRVQWQFRFSTGTFYYNTYGFMLLNN